MTAPPRAGEGAGVYYDILISLVIYYDYQYHGDKGRAMFDSVRLIWGADIYPGAHGFGPQYHSLRVYQYSA